jgi:TadE-like protein
VSRWWPTRLDLRTIGYGARGAGGQGLVEFALLVPVFLLILLGMLEFGFAFNHNMTLEYATREGARAGAAAANGSMTDSSCVDPGTGAVKTFGASDVDPLIIASVERILKSPGSMVSLPNVTSITIYDANPDGTPISGKSDVWPRSLGTGANIPCTYPAVQMDFAAPTSAPWPASSRVNAGTPDLLGVSISYTYNFTSALGGILRFFGGNGAASLPMTDRTVMALEPTK